MNSIEEFQRGDVDYLLATDLVARGLDIPEIRHVVHYQMPVHEDAFIHRNGRTARMHADGQAYIIQGDDEHPTFSQETLASFAEDIEARKKKKNAFTKRFILFTGEGSMPRRELILNIFNGNFDKLPQAIRTPLEPFTNNTSGMICWVIGITGAGAEGISLKCCRSVHIMEPYWNNVRLEQVKGRAIRICSHKDLPYDEREVEIFTYYTIFSQDQIDTNLIDQTIQNADGTKTSDENVYDVSMKKDKINNAFLRIMKEAAVDCNLNQADNNDVICLNITGSMNTYLFDPNLAIDRVTTAIEFKEEKRAEVAPKAAISKVNIGGNPYFICKRPGSGGMIFNIYEDITMKDYYQRIASGQIEPIGEIQLDPLQMRSMTPFKNNRVIFYKTINPLAQATSSANPTPKGAAEP
jgi:hypothetical protein